jgi:hypothetical protein
MLNRMSRVLALGLLLVSPAMVQAAMELAGQACPPSCTECARCPLC